MIIKLADFNFNISNMFGYVLGQTKEYETENCKIDYSFANVDEDIEEERKLSDTEYSFDYLESIATYRKIAEWLPLNNAFLLHSAVFDVDGEGVAFAAHSGTGKTTHMRLWQELLGERMVIVNGDKPIVRFFEDEPNIPYAYGTPWNGKERYGSNTRTPLKHICFIERAEKNSCESIAPNEAVNLIFNQVYMPKDTMARINTMQLINRLLQSCKLWKIKCNMEPDAAKVAYETVFNS